MGFFDNIVDSVSKTAREMSDSAKVLAEKNRIRKDIASIENEMRNRYRDIGQKYFEEMRETPAPEYAELFSGICELRESLTTKQKELDALEGTSSCSACGKQFAKGAKFCPFCGAPAPQVAAPAAPQPTICPSCGAQVANSALFCAVCGTKVATSAAPVANPVNADYGVPQPVAPVTPVVPEVPTTITCSCCGATLQSDALFCAACGTKAPGVE